MHAPTAWQPVSIGESMAHLSGAISGLQVIDCYPCPMVGFGKSNPCFVNGFWVWGPGKELVCRVLKNNF